MPGLPKGADRGCNESFDSTDCRVNALRPLVHNFIKRVIGSFTDVKVDVSATEISDDSVILKGLEFVGHESRECLLLSIELRGKLQEMGFEVLGYWGENLSIRVPRDEFVKIVSGDF